MLDSFFPHHHHDLTSPVLDPFDADNMSGPHTHNPHLQIQMQQQHQHPHGPQYPPSTGTADPAQSGLQRANIDTSQPFPSPVQKQEMQTEMPKAGSSEDKKPPIKPPKTLNRVPRACNACRKQKMRCEGAENPPCRRCRHAGLECLFEKPSREPTLTGEAGLERIRSLESQVSEIRTTQHNIHNTLLELVSHIRSQAASPAFRHTPTSPYTTHSPASNSTVTQGSAVHHPGQPQVPMPMIDPSLTGQTQRPSPRIGNSTLKRGLPPSGYSQAGSSLPPFQPQSSTFQHRPNIPYVPKRSRNNNGKRAADSSSNSSDEEDSAGAGELPSQGLVAPWEVLRSLADAAAERAAKSAGSGSEPNSRARSPSPYPIPPHFHIGHSGNEDLNGGSRDRVSKPPKRRKMHHTHGRQLAFPDVVTKNIITEQEARDLFEIFYHGCSTFLPVFDAKTDTFDALHDRSPFAVDCICMVAARAKCAGGPPSETYRKCLEEVQSICCATLFSPVSRQEAVQAMVLVSGWSDNGWLSGGHAVRMGLELRMNKAWPRLLRHIQTNKMSTTQEERELVISARTWFVLYLFEHQMSYGNGQPAILRFDESIRDCRLLLQHPLSIEDDMRLVSMVELIVLREQVHNRLVLLENRPGEEMFASLRDADYEFEMWFRDWDEKFSQKYPDAGFYRQSLRVQQYFALLFHNATALRGINRPDDVTNMPPAQKQIAIRSIQIAKAGLECSLQASAYRENLRYAVHYTHATATFAATFLIRLARLIPQECDLHAIKRDVEELASVLEQTSAGRYARSLRYMLRKAGERHVLPEDMGNRRTHPPRDVDMTPSHQGTGGSPASSQSARSPTAHFHPGGGPQGPHQLMQPYMAYPPQSHAPPQQWFDGQVYSDSDTHVWANIDLNTGAVMNNGMEAYMIPVGYDQHNEFLRQIW